MPLHPHAPRASWLCAALLAGAALHPTTLHAQSDEAPAMEDAIVEPSTTEEEPAPPFQPRVLGVLAMGMCGGSVMMGPMLAAAVIPALQYAMFTKDAGPNAYRHPWLIAVTGYAVAGPVVAAAVTGWGMLMAAALFAPRFGVFASMPSQNAVGIPVGTVWMLILPAMTVTSLTVTALALTALEPLAMWLVAGALSVPADQR